MSFSQPIDECGPSVIIMSKSGVISGAYPISFYVYVNICPGLLLFGLVLNVLTENIIKNFTWYWVLGFSNTLEYVVSVIFFRVIYKYDPLFGKTVQYWLSIMWMFCGSAMLSFIMVTCMELIKSSVFTIFHG